MTLAAADAIDLEGDTLVISKKGTEWALGCPECRFGIVNSPELTRACELYMERLVQHADGEITYCKCRAGEAAHKRSQQYWAMLLVDARTDADLVEAARRDTHPQIEIARDRIHLARAEGEMPDAPPIHLDSAPVPVADDDEFMPESSPIRYYSDDDDDGEDDVL